MSRRRHRHADPARLPRRPTSAREEHERREAALRQYARLHESLARTTAVLAAAVVYFGFWVTDFTFGVFPPPRTLDLTHPQFVVGIGALVASMFVTRYLATSVPIERLVRYAFVCSAGLAVVLGGLALAILSGTPQRLGEAGPLVAGVGASWVLTALWLLFLVRRLRTLRPLAEGVVGAET